MGKKIALTADRPTGRLHLGHYVGSLRNRVMLQEEYEQYVMVADMQALTDNAGNPQKVRDNVLEVVLDYLAVGIDPAKTCICVQSQLPALSELMMYFLNLVSVSRLERNPTIKEEIKLRKFKEEGIPAGFLTYPVSQAADIVSFGANVVPVGDDQLPLIEQAREIVRRFNLTYGDTLVEPEAIVSKVSRLPGIDGQNKMSKSLNNAIYLADEPDEIRTKVMSMFTDPGHIRVEDPGNVDGNPVFVYLDAFDSNVDKVNELKEHYKRGGLGDVKVKKYLNEVLQEYLRPIREKRKMFADDLSQVRKIVGEGIDKSRDVTNRTLQEVKKAIGIDYKNILF